MENYLLLHYDSVIKQTVIVTKNGSIKYYNGKPMSLIEDCCLLCGASVEGRIKSFQHILKIKQKPCILIDEAQPIILMPTCSMHSLDCWFIQYGLVVRVKPLDSYNSEILFIGGQRVKVPFNFRIIRNQLKRCDSYIQQLSSKNGKYHVTNVSASCYNNEGDKNG